MNVSEVRVGGLDAADVSIKSVFVKKAPSYAIYRTDERVMVHLADAIEEKDRQQEVLAALNPIRGEINGLIDGWRTSRQQDKEALTRLFDRRVADSLAIALEGDSATAQALLKSTLEEIAEERQSRGRIEHLVYAAVTTAGMILLAYVVSLAWNPKVTPYFADDLNTLLFAAAIGSVGALVSIAIAIRERTLATDLQTRDNVADAILRVAVGAVGAVLLIAMLRSDLIDVAVGNVDLAALPQAQTQSGGEQAGVNPSASEQAGTPGAVSPPSDGNAAAAAGGGESNVVSESNVVAPVPPITVDPQAAPADGSGGGGGGPAGAGTAGGDTPGAATALNSVAPQLAEGGADGTGKRVNRRSTYLLEILVIAFFAGFTERLVKQLADRIRFRDVAAAAAVADPAKGTLADRKAAGLARAGGGIEAAGDGFDAAIDVEEDRTDGCLADHDIAEEDLTDDSQLPAAMGGVEEPVGDQRP